MSDLLAARAQMAMSLGFHILFAIVGMAMPLFMVIAEAIWQRTGDPVALDLARRWSKGTAILFAVGAVSGTALSFELGLLWPEFMRHAGPVIGMPFSLEGFAFFLEAIFLGIWLYGWDRISPRLHLLAGAGVWVCGMASGAFVVCANAWMNTPAGFRFDNGVVRDVQPWVAMWNPAAGAEVLHMLIAALEAVGFAVAAIHAWVLLRQPRDRMHRLAFAIALAVGGVAAIVQPMSGHHSAVHVAEHQPVKLAAMEAHFHTARGVGLRIGGWPDEETAEVHASLEIPYALSMLAFFDPNAEVKGLLDVPRDEWPPVAVVHIAFQIMVACGSVLMLVALLAALLAWRRRGIPDDRRLLWAVVLCGPLGVVAVEAGWTVTEVGRQPWIVHGILRTADAVTPMPGLVVPFVVFSLLYAALGFAAIGLLRRHVFATTLPSGPAAASSEVGHG